MLLVKIAEMACLLARQHKLMTMAMGMKLPRQFTEYNVSRLGLISIQSRMPETYRMAWDSVIEEGSNRAGVICRTADSSGVPHGVASDILSGLLTEAAIAFESGLSPSKELVVTAASIARSAHLQIRARHYPLIETALTSMANTKFKVFTHWHDPFSRTSRDATFSILDYLEVQQTAHPFNEEQLQTNYIVRLNREMAHSVEGALVLAINPTILSSLASPGARAVYRMLESLRRDPIDVTRASSTLQLTAQDLVQSTRLLSHRQEAAYMLSILKPMFNALQDVGYLRSWDMVGRGWQTQVKFVFSNDGSLVNTASRRLLEEAGVTGQNAESLAVAHSREEIECAIWVVDGKTQRDPTIRNPAGMLVKLLKDGTARDALPRFRERHRVLSSASRTAPRVQTGAMSAVQKPVPATPENAAAGILETLVQTNKMSMGLGFETGCHFEGSAALILISSSRSNFYFYRVGARN